MRFNLTIFFFAVLLPGAYAQQVAGIDDIYGYDPLLYNGKYYTFHIAPGTEGNQYFSGKEFRAGSVRLRGLIYEDLSLNYDVYNQQLIFRYNTPAGGFNQIIISDAWLEAFSLKDAYFEMITASDSTKKIFQVLGEGPSRLLYHWKKKLELNTFHGSKNFVFTTAREMNLLLDEKILPYHNNRSFVSLFDQGKRNIMKIYMRRNRIKVKKADDKVMTGLIDYFNSL